MISKNARQTEEYGKELAANLMPGTVIGLIGDLGTGKTTMAKAIAKGLDIKEHISSPTFTIIKEYDSGRLPLYHFDVYRLGDPDEMYELGYEEYFYGEGVTIVEWADKILDLMPKDAKIIEISYTDKEDERKIEVRQI